jgi:hypothetical protein
MTMEPKTATCWSGAKVWCRSCKGPTEALDDEYGSLADGGSYERFICAEHKGQACADIIYVQLPD